MKHEEFCPYAHYEGVTKNCPYCVIIRQEREAAAKVATSLSEEWPGQIADAIRARGEICLLV